MGDFLVQHFRVPVSPVEFFTDTKIPRTIDPSHTRVMPGSPCSQMFLIGYDSASDTLNSRDVMAGIEILDGSTVRVHSSPLKQFSGVCVFSLLSYIGEPGGANEFLVYRDNTRMSGTGVSVKSFGSWQPAEDGAKDLTLHIVGKTFGDFATVAPAGDQSSSLNWQPRMIFDGTVSEWDLLTTSNIPSGVLTVTAWVWWEYVDWVGSNWTINRVPYGLQTAGTADAVNFTVPNGAGNPVIIPDVGSWGNTWIEGYRGSDLAGSPVAGESMAHVLAGSSTTSVIGWTPIAGSTTIDGFNGFGFYCMSNPEIKVNRQGFLDLTGYPPINSEINQERKVNVPSLDTTGVVIDAGPDRVVPILMGTPRDGTLGFDDHAIEYTGQENPYRIWRNTPGSRLFEYIQSIQFGLDPSSSGKLRGSIIEQPTISATIRNT